MRLVVVATPGSVVPDAAPGDRVLTLAGVSPLGVHEPEGILRVAESAAANVRARFPGWLWDWVSANGLLDLAIFDGPTSWWWYAPLSEKSPSRSELVRQVYWLTLLRLLLEDGDYEHVRWVGCDRQLAEAAGSVVRAAGATFEMLAPQRQRMQLLFLLARAVVRVPHRVLLWLVLRALGFGRVVMAGLPPDVFLFSQFPMLWERAPGDWAERMYGSWPGTLERAGKIVAYPAISSAPLSQLVREGRQLAERSRQQRVWILDASLSLAATVRAYLPVGLFVRYVRWRYACRGRSVSYDGVDITALVWRELNRNVFGAAIGMNRVVAAGLRLLVRQLPSLRAIFHPFEYQPMERAVWGGAKTVRDVAVIGLQTGLFTSNQMGFAFPKEEARIDRESWVLAPVPDFLVAYGELPQRVFAERLGDLRVCLAGPLRYPGLSAHGAESLEAFRVSSGLPGDALFVALVTPANRDEALPLLHRTFAAFVDQPNLYLLVKYHYHLLLDEEIARLTRRWPGVRHRVFSSNLYPLMRLSRAVICAGTSVGIEAIACGRMPLVYHHVGQMSPNPMLHVPDAVFFWQSAEELQLALRSTLSRDAAYLSRAAAWNDAVAAHLLTTDGSPDARLLEFLVSQEVL